MIYWSHNFWYYFDIGNLAIASDIRISCITSDGSDADFRIDNVGGINADNSRWKLTIDEAINGINSGKWTFYTFEGGHRANVVIRTSSAGRQYLTTLPDNFAGNNLSRLRQWQGVELAVQTRITQTAVTLKPLQVVFQI